MLQVGLKGVSCSFIGYTESGRFSDVISTAVSGVKSVNDEISNFLQATPIQ